MCQRGDPHKDGTAFPELGGGGGGSLCLEQCVEVASLGTSNEDGQINLAGKQVPLELRQSDQSPVGDERFLVSFHYFLSRVYKIKSNIIMK